MSVNIIPSILKRREYEHDEEKMLAMALTGAMCASLLVGCSDAESQSSENASSDGTYNIAMIVKLKDSHFNKVMAGAQAYADEHSNVSLDIQAPTSATAYVGFPIAAIRQCSSRRARVVTGLRLQRRKRHR